MEKKNNSFIFYGSFLETVEELDKAYPEMASELLRAICDYGIYGEYNDSNPIINSMMVNIGFGIDKAQERYAKAKENGKLGGRPKIELNKEAVIEKKKQLRTWKAVADYYKISEQTLRNKRQEWEIVDVSPIIEREEKTIVVNTKRKPSS